MTKRSCSRCSTEFTPKSAEQFCKYCLRELKEMKDAGKIVDAPRSAIPAPSRTGFRALEYKESFEYNGILFTGDEIHRVIYFHWKKNPDVWFKENITSAPQLLRQLPRMIDRCPPDFRIPMRLQLGSPNSACSLCHGEGRWIDWSQPSSPIYAREWLAWKEGEPRCQRKHGTREDLEAQGWRVKYIFPAFVSPCECVTATEVEK